MKWTCAIQGAVEAVLHKHEIDAVIHFAGLKAMGESASIPMSYYSNNVLGSISPLEAMQSVGIKKLIFSSSATIYGEPVCPPYDEEHPTHPMNVYAKIKLQAESILQDLMASDSDWQIISLRCFNLVGAHESGLIGEDPNRVPNNLMPYIAKVGIEKLPHVNIFGVDYKALDGSGERVYIYAMDLASGRIAALDYLSNNFGWEVFNLGVGRSVSGRAVRK